MLRKWASQVVVPTWGWWRWWWWCLWCRCQRWWWWWWRRWLWSGCMGMLRMWASQMVVPTWVRWYVDENANGDDDVDDDGDDDGNDYDHDDGDGDENNDDNADDGEVINSNWCKGLYIPWHCGCKGGDVLKNIGSWWRWWWWWVIFMMMKIPWHCGSRGGGVQKNIESCQASPWNQRWWQWWRWCRWRRRWLWSGWAVNEVMFRRIYKAVQFNLVIKDDNHGHPQHQREWEGAMWEHKKVTMGRWKKVKVKKWKREGEEEESEKVWK